MERFIRVIHWRSKRAAQLALRRALSRQRAAFEKISVCASCEGVTCQCWEARQREVRRPRVALAVPRRGMLNR